MEKFICLGGHFPGYGYFEIGHIYYGTYKYHSHRASNSKLLTVEMEAPDYLLSRIIFSVKEENFEGIPILKNHFISVREFREQKINDILS